MLRVEELEELSRYQAGDLGPDEARRVERELSSNPELARALDRLQRLDAAAKDLSASSEASSDGQRDEAIARALRAAQRARPSPRASRVAVAAGVLIAVGAGAAAWRVVSSPTAGGRTTGSNPPQAWAQVVDLPGGALVASAGARYTLDGDVLHLEQGVLYIRRAHLDVVRGSERASVSGEALVFTEPSQGLAHETESLRPNPARTDMTLPLEAFKNSITVGRARCITAALLTTCAFPSAASANSQRGVATPAPTAPGPAVASADDPVVRVEEGDATDASPVGDLAAFNAVLHAAAPDLVNCYRVPESGATHASGTFIATLSLDADGSVRKAEASPVFAQRSPQVSRCVSGVLGGLKFAPLAGHAPTLLLRFSAAVDGQGSDRRLVVHLPMGIPATPVDSTVPPQREVHLDLSHAPASRGPADAPITLVEVTDLACGYCANAHQTLAKLAEAYPGKFRRVVLLSPLALDPAGPRAAAAALAADRQGKFWPFIDGVFAHPKALARADLDAQARSLGLDMARFDADMDSSEVKAQLDANVDEADRWEIFGRPAVVLNDLVWTGALPLEIYTSAVQMVLSGQSLAASPADTAAAPKRPTAPERLDNVELLSLSDGSKSTLNALRKKVLVVNFWSSMSSSDLQAQQALQQVAEAFKGDPDVGFMVINVDSSQPSEVELAELHRQIQRSKLSLPVYEESPQAVAYVNDRMPRRPGMPENQIFVPDLAVLRDVNDVRYAGFFKGSEGGKLGAEELERLRGEIRKAER